MKNLNDASPSSRTGGWAFPAKGHSVLINNFLGDNTQVAAQKSFLKKRSDSVDTTDTKLTSASGQTLHAASTTSSSSASWSSTKGGQLQSKTPASRRNSISPERNGSTSTKPKAAPAVPNGVAKRPADQGVNGVKSDLSRRSSSNNLALSRRPPGRMWRRSSKAEDQIAPAQNGSGEGAEEKAESGDMWTLFEDHLKSIPSTGETFVRRPRPTFTSSDHFQKVMKDMYGRADYNVPVGYSKFRAKIGNLTFLASHLTRIARRHSLAEEEGEETDVDEVGSDSEQEVSAMTRQNAERGWRLLRSHVTEMRRDMRNTTAKLQWAMIKQTLRQMSDLDRARLDLYKRYGVVPTLNDDGTVVQVNTMLSEKAQRAELAARRRSRHGLAVSLPPAGTLRPSSESRASPRGPQSTSSKTRPRTAKDARNLTLS